MNRFKKGYDYFVNSLSAMSIGLFSTLIVGVIIENLGFLIGLSATLAPVQAAFVTVAGYAKSMVGPAIVVAMAYRMDKSMLVIAASVVVGLFAYQMGGPIGAYISGVVAIEVGDVISNKNPLRIILIPFLVIFAGYLISITLGKYAGLIMNVLGVIINEATLTHPFFMSIIISSIMGVLLTSPLSSAALAIMLQLSGLAAGAATVGCCVHMVGFAHMGRKANSIGTTIAVGLGTSMLQIKNILLNMYLIVPPIIVSIILGPIGTLVFQLQSNPEGAGMGTSGLVGPIMMLSTMGYTVQNVIIILLMCIILPIVLIHVVTAYFIKTNKIKHGDLKIEIES